MADETDVEEHFHGEEERKTPPPCSSCSGSGFVINWNFFDGPSVARTFTCFACRGRGYVSFIDIGSGA